MAQSPNRVNEAIETYILQLEKQISKYKALGCFTLAQREETRRTIRKGEEELAKLGLSPNDCPLYAHAVAELVRSFTQCEDDFGRRNKNESDTGVVDYPWFGYR